MDTFRRRQMIKELYDLLNKKEYYSLSLDYVTRITGIPERVLWQFDREGHRSRARDFEDQTGDSINVFRYNQIRYIGLESRRIDYMQDEKAGINWVADAIKEGKYG